jgi:hypothetical protein
MAPTLQEVISALPIDQRREVEEQAARLIDKETISGQDSFENAKKRPPAFVATSTLELIFKR